MVIILKTPQEVLRDIAQKAREKRLTLNLSQEGLCLRSGVSLGSLKRFEATGQISLESLLKVGHALNCLSDFEALFRIQPNRNSLFVSEKPVKKRFRGKLK